MISKTLHYIGIDQLRVVYTMEVDHNFGIVVSINCISCNDEYHIVMSINRVGYNDIINTPKFKGVHERLVLLV